MVSRLIVVPLLFFAVGNAGAVDDLSGALGPIREEAALPALGAAAIVDGKLVALGAVGLRKHKGGNGVTTDDKWHIGSNTKSMTATLAATFVEEGELSWDTTLGETLGRAIRMRKEYKDVTLLNLLSNRSGIPGQVPPKIWGDTWKKDGRGKVTARRLEFVEEMLNLKPSFAPGTDYEYSNAGFVTAGAMLEAVAGESWETLMTERLFKPLKMNSAGFGAAASVGKEDQPWGHHPPNKPKEPGPGDDNPRALGPAGTVHASLADLARYVQMHTLRETGPVVKKEKTYEVLHRIAEGNKNYACGWLVEERGWADGEALTHSGSNTMNYCVFWIAPKRRFAAIAVTNAGGNTAARACDTAVGILVRKYAE